MATPIHTRTIDQIQITNDYQDTGVINLTSTNSRRLLRTWRIETGRNIGDHARIRDTYIKVKLIFKNDANHHTLILHDLVSLYVVPAESVGNKLSEK